MSKTGGPATLSSLRVQKAFSINFRENKRLYAQLKLIEAERVRAIRQAKQEITETKLWLEGVQQTTGDSDKTWMAESDSRNSSRLGRRSVSRISENEHKMEEEQSRLVNEEANLYGRKSPRDVIPLQHVRFSQSVRGQRPAPPNTDMAPPQTAPSVQRQSFSHSQNNREKMPDITEENKTEGEEVTELYGESVGKSRLHSANSKNSQQSLTAYQRRKQLKSLILKKRNPLDIKKEINSRECTKVNDKVMDYVLNIADRLQISIPDFETTGIPVMAEERD